MAQPIELFYCYARADEHFLQKLQKQLKPLEYAHLIRPWHDRQIEAGADFSKAIETHLDAAQLILLLISSNFLASGYCYGVELQRVLARHQRAEVHIIPVILQPCLWEMTPIGHLQALPTDGRPITDTNFWPLEETAWLSVARGIRDVVLNFQEQEVVNNVSSPLLQPLVQPGSSRHFVLASTLNGHGKAVLSLALTDDGRTLVSGSGDTTIKVWDLTTERERHSLVGHTQDVWCLSLDASGRTLISGSGDGIIKVWDLATGQARRTFAGHKGPVYSVALSSDGRMLISGGEDGVLKVWDLVIGRAQQIFYGHAGAVWSVAFDSKRHLPISGSKDTTIKTWDLATGREQFTFHGHKHFVYALALNDEGRLLASGGGDSLVKIWDLTTNQIIQILTGHNYPVRALAFEHEGSTLVSASNDATIKIWNLATGSEQQTLTGHNGGISALAHGRDILVSGDADGIIKVWRQI